MTTSSRPCPSGEDPSVRLPVMVCQDGFITSHALENIVLLDTDSVKAFVGEYHPEHYLLKAENPWPWGPTTWAAITWSTRSSRPRP